MPGEEKSWKHNHAAMSLLLSMSSLMLVIQYGMFHCCPPDCGTSVAGSMVSDGHTLMNNLRFEPNSGTLRT